MAKQLYLPEEHVKALNQANRKVDRKLKEYNKAAEERREVFTAAREAGMTYYAISKALGGSPNEIRVAKIIQKGTGNDSQ